MDQPFWIVSYALARIVFCFAVIMWGARKRWPLELSLGLAGFGLALLSGMTPLAWGQLAWNTLTGSGFLTVFASLFVILLLSGTMETSGQTQRLVHSVGRRIASRRAQLFLFPAFIGFFPVPGGAIFSCPMVAESAKDLGISQEDKTLLNYWFRHVWELCWPLFPGFILYVGLAEISPFTAISYNWPSCLMAICGGWYLLLRRCPGKATLSDLPMEQPESASQPHGSIIMEALPLLVGMVGAFAAMVIWPGVPAGLLFALAFVVGLAVCLAQNRLGPASLWPLVKAPRTRGILFVVAAIFIFKDLLTESHVLDVFGLLAQNHYALFLICTLFPLLSGVLTGLMVAFVGVALPMVVTVIEQGGLWDERLPWLTLAVMFGNIGQLLSPVHVCLVVTCRFFETEMGVILRRLAVPCALLIATAVLWFLFLLTCSRGTFSF